MYIIFYIIFILIINYFLVFYDYKEKILLINISNLKSTNLPNIYVNTIENLLLIYNKNKCRTLDDIKYLTEIYNKLLDYVNTIDTIYSSPNILQIKNQLISDIKLDYKLKLNTFNNKINYNNININHNYFINPLI